MQTSNLAMDMAGNDELKQQIDACKFSYLSNSTVVYRKPHKQDLLIVNSPSCYAVFSLQGAQLLEFRPHGDDDWLWLSPLASFEPGKAIRGGIPVCLPWFGVNQQTPEKPKHGFVRDNLWQLSQVEERADKTIVCFDFSYDGEQAELFDTPFHCQLQFELGRELNIQIKLKNCSDQNSLFSWALHSYFAVEHSVKALVNGLDAQNFLDNTQGLAVTAQAGSVVFAGEVDRVYEATQTPQTLLSQHHLHIEGTNCPSCIVWNPGALAAMRMEDVKQHYSNFICVERGCAFGDSLHLNAGETFRSTMSIKKIA